MPSNWNKGQTKYTNLSVKKISDTMKAKGIDNFSKWREEMRKLGKIKSVYPDFDKNGDLAELIGVILGDGHIEVFPRSESLSLFSHSDDHGFVSRYSDLIQKIFKKKPYVAKRKGENCIKISIYENKISSRLNIPSGARGKKEISVPNWILSNTEFIVRYLRGLYEAEGSYCVHKPTRTYKLFFSNRNQSLLKNVFLLVKKLGFNPHMRYCDVQVSRKAEVCALIKLLQFRKY
jgi:DNA-binding transcriptional regulator WhiA